MGKLRDILMAKASTVIPGDGYNAFRSQHQTGEGTEVAPLHFEDMLPMLAPERALVERTVPSLVRFLQRKKQNPENPRNVMVALFLGESCFVLSADAVYDVFCELEGTSRQVLGLRSRTWLA
jgi:hypothetical protein